MGVLTWLAHPTELWAMVQYAASNPGARDSVDNVDDPSLRRCYEFLTLTSRSFTVVIKQLPMELRDPICLYYLALRGLDTIEDDMTIPTDYKVTLLHNFHGFLTQPGWCFTESGESEKDAQLLVEYEVVIDQMLKLDPKYSKIIIDSAKRMGHGMADFCVKKVTTKADFEQYCHYVAGLVGIGLSALFSASELESPQVAEAEELANSLGLFLQKTNIIRDYHEDLFDTRQFWPKEIWGLYAKELKDLTEPGNKKAALACLNHMCLDALKHIPDIFEYLAMLKDPSIFRFVAIPQVMAIATITEVFNNYQVFQRNVKIRKGEAVKLILQSSDINTVRGVFIDYLHRLHAKNSSTDPSYTKVNMLVGSALAHIVPHYQAPACATSAPVLLVAALLTVLVALVYQWQGMLV